MDEKPNSHFLQQALKELEAIGERVDQLSDELENQLFLEVGKADHGKFRDFLRQKN